MKLFFKKLKVQLYELFKLKKVSYHKMLKVGHVLIMMTHHDKLAMSEAILKFLSCNSYTVNEYLKSLFLDYTVCLGWLFMFYVVLSFMYSSH